MFGIADGFDVVIGNPPYVRGDKIRDKARLRAAYGGFYRGTADLYTYFFWKGIDLLRPAGLLCLITSNKFMRSDYGEPLRVFLRQHAIPRLLLDLGRTGTFDATVRPCIVLSAKEEARETLRAVTVRGVTGPDVDPAAFMNEHGFAMPVAHLADAGWSLAPPAWQAVRAKIEAEGQPLTEYVSGQLYRGIVTGLNDAFVIDADTRAWLIAEDPNSAELIRPWLRGRDVRRWRADYVDLYVIFSRRGTPIERYPAVESHLSRYRRDLEPKRRRGAKYGRKPGSYQWFEIQDNIAYYQAFDQPKIIYPEIAREMRALLDRQGRLTNNKCFLIPRDDLYLLALLNSKLLDFYFRLAMPCLDDPFSGGDMEYRAVFMAHTPIAPAHAKTKQRLASLADRIQTDKETDPDANTADLESRINEEVYSLYGLNSRDITVIEKTLP